MSEKTYVCRCEDVTLDELQALIDQGLHKMEEIKRVSRCTMGACQGRTCRNILAQTLAERTEVPVSEIDIPTYRAPVKPIKLGTIAGGEKDV